MTRKRIPVSSVIACSLDDQALDAQLVEWADLRSNALSTRAITGGVESTYPLALAADVDDLVTRENQCCGSWLRAEAHVEAERIRVVITTDNPDGVDLIREIARLTPQPPPATS